MKITGVRQESFVAGPDPEVVCVLLYGPDRGLIRERALKLAKTVVDAPDDPFRVVELSGSDIKNDPARLADEAQALALGGGRRLIRLRDITDATTKLIGAYLEIANKSDAFSVLKPASLDPGPACASFLRGPRMPPPSPVTPMIPGALHGLSVKP